MQRPFVTNVLFLVTLAPVIWDVMYMFNDRLETYMFSLLLIIIDTHADANSGGVQTKPVL